jgi:hypothetical protein
MTNDDILILADKHLEYSDFGRFYGSEDDILELAHSIMELHLKERNLNNEIIE